MKMKKVSSKKKHKPKTRQQLESEIKALKERLRKLDKPKKRILKGYQMKNQNNLCKLIKGKLNGKPNK